MSNYCKSDDLCLDILHKYARVGWSSLCLHPKHATQVVDEVTKRVIESQKRFADFEFPPIHDCVSKTASLRPGGYRTWKRPEVFVRGKGATSPCLFLDGVSAADILQGSVGDCWLLQSIASVAGE